MSSTAAHVSVRSVVRPPTAISYPIDASPGYIEDNVYCNLDVIHAGTDNIKSTVDVTAVRLQETAAYWT